MRKLTCSSSSSPPHIIIKIIYWLLIYKFTLPLKYVGAGGGAQQSPWYVPESFLLDSDAASVLGEIKNIRNKFASHNHIQYMVLFWRGP